MSYCRLLIFFLQNKLFENDFRNTSRMSNRLDPDQVRRFVGPYMGPNCLPKLTADDPCGNQRTDGPVNAHLTSWPSKAQNIQNLENIW